MMAKNISIKMSTMVRTLAEMDDGDAKIQREKTDTAAGAEDR